MQLTDVLLWGLSALGGLIMWGTQVGPRQAVSHAAEWAKTFGVKKPPRWLQSEDADRTIRHIGLGIVVICGEILLANYTGAVAMSMGPKLLFAAGCAAMVGAVIWSLSKPGVSNSPVMSPTSGAFTLGKHIYAESRTIKAADGRETKLYENSFYLIAGNQSEDGKTLKRVQARVHFVDAPVLLATLKDTTANETDIRQGEWAFFMVGRIVSSKILGTYNGYTTVDDNFLKAYEHNIPMGGLSFEVWSYETKRRYALAYQPEHPNVWNLPIVVSADDQKSLSVVVDINLGDLTNPVSIHQEATGDAKKRS
jgi:hypothetical protein